MKALGSLVFALIVAAPQTVAAGVAYRPMTLETPDRGKISRASVGEALWEKADVVGAPAVAIQEPVNVAWGSLEAVNLSEGQTLIVIREKKLKACAEATTTALGGVTVNGFNSCLIDDDDDGTFDKASYNDVGFSKKLDQGVRYTRTVGQMTGGAAPNFRRVLTYLGVSDHALRLSYREFSNGMARPAFTEELTVPLTDGFPQFVSVKGLRISLIALDGSGLTYRIEP